MDISKLQHDLQLVSVSPTTFTNKYPLHVLAGNLIRGNSFGGCLIYQSTLAGFLTIENIDDYYCLSVHSSFIDGVKNDTECFYNVEILRNGKSFQHRLVKLIQNDKVVYIATVCFGLIAQNKKFGKQPIIDDTPIPNFGVKDTSKNPFVNNQFNTNIIDDDKLFYTEEEACIKRIDCVEIKKATNSIKGKKFFEENDPIPITDRNIYFWTRLKEPKSNYSIDDNSQRYDLMNKQLSIGYISDLSFIMNVGEILGLGYGNSHENFKLSLDHTIYFQKPISNNFNYSNYDWLFSKSKLLKMDGDGKCVISMSVFNKFGQMLAIVNQEAFCVYDNRNEHLFGKL